MTNFEWLKTLTEEEFTDWLYNDWLDRLQYLWSSSRGGLIIWLKDRKTENSSEIPNNATQHVQHVGSVETMSCQECRRWIYDDRWGWFCPLKGQDECKYEPKTEPQTERSE